MARVVLCHRSTDAQQIESQTMRKGMKPNKSVAKRFKVTKTGKLKHARSYTSHLRSARSSKTKRRLRHAAILSERMAGNLRGLLGAAKLKPARTVHERKLAAKAEAATSETK
jgi:large subunit ribosomal protein L35